MVDPLEPEEGTNIEPTITKSSVDINLTDLNNSNMYKLETEDGTEVTEYIKPEDGEITFEGLKRGTKYYLVAKTEDGEICGSKVFKKRIKL